MSSLVPHKSRWYSPAQLRPAVSRPTFDSTAFHISASSCLTFGWSLLNRGDNICKRSKCLWRDCNTRGQKSVFQKIWRPVATLDNMPPAPSPNAIPFRIENIFMPDWLIFFCQPFAALHSYSKLRNSMVAFPGGNAEGGAQPQPGCRVSCHRSTFTRRRPQSRNMLLSFSAWNESEYPVKREARGREN